MVRGNLIVKPLGARISSEKEIICTDPFCVLKLGTHKKQTKVHKNGGKMPSWVPEQFVFKVDNEESMVVEV